MKNKLEKSLKKSENIDKRDVKNKLNLTKEKKNYNLRAVGFVFFK